MLKSHKLIFIQFVASIHIISSLFKPFHANEGYDNIYYRVRKILWEEVNLKN